MKNMTLEKIAKVTEGKLFVPEGFEGVEKKEIQGAVNDNRKVEKDYLFIPMVGARVDGHDFIEGAFKDGALATLSERELENPLNPLGERYRDSRKGSGLL